jgi:hypothetical protein
MKVSQLVVVRNPKYLYGNVFAQYLSYFDCKNTGMTIIGGEYQ